MIRLSKLTDYGILILTHLATDADNGVRTARDLARQTRIPEPTVSKVLKILTQESLTVSQRGVGGGYRLNCRPAEISLVDIIRALEGPIALMECTEVGGQCEQEETCLVKGHWQVINHAVNTTLRNLSLHDLTIPMRMDRLRSIPASEATYSDDREENPVGDIDG